MAKGLSNILEEYDKLNESITKSQDCLLYTSDAADE